MQLSLQIVYISGMGKAQKDIQTIQHRNMWGEWTFTFEGNTLCGLRFSGSGESSIVPSSVKACAYATPDTDIPLTLSGHTHAMQFRIGNLTPVVLKYPEWGGQYEENGQQLFVSTGVGGNIPFRFGAWPEICVLTLRCK